MIRKVLIGLASLAVLSAGAIASTGTAMAVNFTCAYQHVCFFQNNDWTGNVKDYDALQVENNLDSWTLIPQGERGAVTEQNPSYNVQVYAANTGAHQTVFSGSRAVLNGTFGWWCTGAWNDCNNNLPSVRTTSVRVPSNHVSKCSNANAKAIKVKTNTPKFGGLTVKITHNPGRCWLRAGGSIRNLSFPYNSCEETDIVPIRNVGDHERIEPADVQGCPFVVTPGFFIWSRWGVWYNNAKGHRVFKVSGHRSTPAPVQSKS